MSMGNNGVRVCDSGSFGHNSTDRIKDKTPPRHTINDEMRICREATMVPFHNKLKFFLNYLI